MIHPNIIIAMYFILAVVNDFTGYAELDWLERYSLPDINYLTAAIDLAWLPCVSVAVGYVSDRCRKHHIGFTDQIIFITFSTGAMWAVIGSVVMEAPNFSSLFILIFMILATFGPSSLQTILDGARAVTFNKDGTNLTVHTERAKLVGSIVASLGGGIMMHYETAAVTFLTQCGVLVVTSMAVLIAHRVQHRCQKPVEDYNAVTELELTDLGLDEEEPPATEQPEEENVGRVRGCLRYLCRANPDEPMVNRRFRLVLAIQTCLPVADLCLYYFAVGPLQMTTVEFGIIAGAAQGIELMSTWTYKSINLNLRDLAFLSAVSFAISQFLMLVLVTRLTIEYISTFHFVLLVSCVSAFVRGNVSLAYNSLLTENSSKGGETWDISVRKTMPRMGMAMRIGMDSMLTSLYGVDHGQYNNLPYYLTLTCLLSTIYIWTVLLIPQTPRAKEDAVIEG